MMQDRKLTIVLAQQADPIEQYAAQELRKYVQLLYGFEPRVVADPSIDPDGPTALIGRAAEHPRWARAAGDLKTDSLAADGFVLKTIRTSPDVLLIAGAQGRGVLFGVYDLLERWGMRFLLSGEVVPPKPEPLSLSGFDQRTEPAYAIRGMRPMANVPEGSAPWDLSDFTDFIDRMARMKFNTFVFIVQESGPWLDYEFRGMKRPAGDIFYGHRIPIGEHFVGRELFGGKSEFYNPILAKAQDEQQRKQLGIGLIRDIIRHCKLRGLMTVMVFGLLEPPTAMKHKFNDWASLPLPDPELFKGAAFTETPAEELGTNPKYAAWMNVMDPVVQDLTAHRLKTLIDTYPDADYYHLWVSEHRAGVVDYRDIFRDLDRKHHLSPGFDLEKTLEDHTSSPFDRERYQSQIKGDLLFLYMLDKILNDRKLLQQTGKPDAQIGIAGVMPQLAPILTKILPPGATFVQFVDYGSHGPADRINLVVPPLKAGVPTTLEVGIHDDNDMYFPQANVESLQRIVQTTAPLHMLGYIVALWQIRQSDIGSAYLGEASWRPALTADAFYKDFLPRLVGAGAAADFERGHRIIEAADREVRTGLLYGYAFLFTSKLVDAFLHSGLDRPAMAHIRPQFQSALDCFKSARAHASDNGIQFVDFWIKRTQFALDWLEMACLCDDLGKQLGPALKPESPVTADQQKTALAAYDTILDRSRKLIELIAGDARHIGDLGQIAGMNRYLHQYLIQRCAEMANRRPTTP